MTTRRANRRRRRQRGSQRERVVRRVEISGGLDRRAVEALGLELRRLAKRHGVRIRAIRIEPKTRARS